MSVELDKSHGGFLGAGGKATHFFPSLEKVKLIESRSFSPISDCPLCGWPPLDAERLAKIISTLAVNPIGKKISLRGAVEIIGHGYKNLSRDLHTLIHGLRLPVKRSYRCLWLAEAIPLCQSHLEIGEQFRQTDHFKKTFPMAQLKARVENELLSANL
jgi:hypothetical protein